MHAHANKTQMQIKNRIQTILKELGCQRPCTKKHLNIILMQYSLIEFQKN